ncbi:MAG: helix-turn-helix domain-containing protein [Oscillospiraceae bacterium]|nr:helix-turn-helix domain-containing protein [Oscillospiraceae bacterium]
MTLGEKIHQLRKARGMSQEALASHLTVSRQAVSKWELTESVPDTENIVQLSRLFGVSTDYLLVDDHQGDNDALHVKVADISSDDDAAAKNNTGGKERKSRIAACVLLVSGLVGILTLLILSSTIVAYRTVQVGYISEVRQVAPPPPAYSGAGELLTHDYVWEDMGTIPAFGSVPVRGNLPAFLGTYNLGWLFALCVISAVVGAAMLLYAHTTVTEAPPEDEEALL